MIAEENHEAPSFPGAVAELLSAGGGVQARPVTCLALLFLISCCCRSWYCRADRQTRTPELSLVLKMSIYQHKMLNSDWMSLHVRWLQLGELRNRTQHTSYLQIWIDCAIKYIQWLKLIEWDWLCSLLPGVLMKGYVSFYFQGLAYLHMKGKMHRDIKVTGNFENP